jgi:hypothetical protein
MKQGVKIGTKVNLMASKLTNSDTACYYLTNTRSVDSHGFPFYKLSGSETKKIQ